MKMRRRKTARAPVIAAGGIIVRSGSKPLIAIVQRRKDNFWVLPKGKLKPKENPVAAAQREASEETGHDVTLHEFLGAISYKVSGRPKIVHFWRMQAENNPARDVMDDIRAVAWLPLDDAVRRLTQPLERTFLGHLGDLVLASSRRAKRKVNKRRRKPKTRKAAARRPRAGLSSPKIRRTTRQQSRSRRVAARHKTASMPQVKAPPVTAISRALVPLEQRGIIRRIIGRLRPGASNVTKI